MKREFDIFVEEILEEGAVKLFVARDFKTKKWVVKWMEDGDFVREKFQYFPTEEKAKAFKDRMMKVHGGLFEGGERVVAIEDSSKPKTTKAPVVKFKNKESALIYLRKNPLKCVQWGDNQAIYWNGKIKIVKADKEYDWAKTESINEGGQCTGPTKKASSTSKGKKWMKCVKQPDGKYKRVHWGQKGVKVTGKSGDTKRKKSFKARHNCSQAKKGSAQAQACKDWQ